MLFLFMKITNCDALRLLNRFLEGSSQKLEIENHDLYCDENACKQYCQDSANSSCENHKCLWSDSSNASTEEYSEGYYCCCVARYAPDQQCGTERHVCEPIHGSIKGPKRCPFDDFESKEKFLSRTVLCDNIGFEIADFPDDDTMEDFEADGIDFRTHAPSASLWGVQKTHISVSADLSNRCGIMFSPKTTEIVGWGPGDLGTNNNQLYYRRKHGLTWDVKTSIDKETYIKGFNAFFADVDFTNFGTTSKEKMRVSSKFCEKYSKPPYEVPSLCKKGYTQEDPSIMLEKGLYNENCHTNEVVISPQGKDVIGFWVGSWGPNDNPSEFHLHHACTAMAAMKRDHGTDVRVHQCRFTVPRAHLKAGQKETVISDCIFMSDITYRCKDILKKNGYTTPLQQRH